MGRAGRQRKASSKAAQTSKTNRDKESLEGSSSQGKVLSLIIRAGGLLEAADSRNTGEIKHVFESGAVRSATNAGSKEGSSFPARFDLISPYGLQRLAETYGEGSLKYSDRNWEKGLPISNCIDHALAHINAYLRGERKEDDLAHAAWNLFAAMHFEEVMPIMQDIPARLLKEEKNVSC